MNSTIDNLREAVLTDARALAYEIVQDAMKAGQGIASETETLIARDRETAGAEAEAEAGKQRQKIEAEAESDLQRTRRASRERMIERVLARVRARLSEAASDPEEGPKMLLRLAIEGARAVAGDDVRLLVRQKDREWVDRAFLKDVKRETDADAELAMETIDALGGVVVVGKDGRERFDNTLDNRLARQMPDVRAMIWARLSHAG